MPLPFPEYTGDDGAVLALDDLAANEPSVAACDLTEVVALTEALQAVMGSPTHRVYISRAIIELWHANGYKVGTLTFDAGTEVLRFFPTDPSEHAEWA